MRPSDTVKRKSELQLVEVFRANFAGFPAGRMEHLDAPDFLVHRKDSRVLGIEVTEICHHVAERQVSMREQESLRRAICARARDDYDALGGPKLHVTVHFYDDHPLSKARMSSIAAFLTRYFVDHAPAEGGEHEELSHSGQLPLEMHRIAIRNQPAWVGGESFVSSPVSSWIPTLSTADIQAAADAKESALPAYRARAGEVWLLLGVNTHSIATSFQGVAAAASAAPIRSSFDKVFLVEPFGSTVTSLSLLPVQA